MNCNTIEHDNLRDKLRELREARVPSKFKREQRLKEKKRHERQNSRADKAKS